MLEASRWYASLMSSDKAPSGYEKSTNCTAFSAAVAATSMLAMLRIVPRPLVAPCDESWDCVLRSAEMVVPGVAKDSAC